MLSRNLSCVTSIQKNITLERLMVPPPIILPLPIIVTFCTLFPWRNYAHRRPCLRPSPSLSLLAQDDICRSISENGSIDLLLQCIEEADKQKNKVAAKSCCSLLIRYGRMVQHCKIIVFCFCPIQLTSSSLFLKLAASDNQQVCYASVRWFWKLSWHPYFQKMFL
jgi:hypothetical protein